MTAAMVEMTGTHRPTWYRHMLKPDKCPSDDTESTSSQTMAAEDIADAITYIVTRPRTVAINELLVRPTEQER